ncbi:MAG: hypothetical protein ACRCTR_08150 [Actinomycetota bacterium]
MLDHWTKVRRRAVQDQQSLRLDNPEGLRRAKDTYAAELRSLRESRDA